MKVAKRKMHVILHHCINLLAFILLGLHSQNTLTIDRSLFERVKGKERERERETDRQTEKEREE